MNLAIVGNSSEIDKFFLEKVANAAFSFLRKEDGEIELNFVTEKEITDLNSKYRNINNVTDVLSFKISDNPLIGQVFICYNVAKEQAINFNKSLDEEIALLLTHGILHVYDYDHLANEDSKVMEEIETKILNKLGMKR